MFKTTLSLLLCIILTCCNSSDIPKHTNPNSLQKNIIGKWGGAEGESAIWEIKSDSIYYFEEQKSYACRLSGDSLMVDYKEGTFYLRDITVVNDTMVFYDESGLKISGYRKSN
jgi:hypothetical protein